ncbi:MAG: hypothetical protein K0V04_22465 [Deltaproteobacteria bacterium]|nr:hypothetical protein [Deltaproteobacteria bacterium]
MATAAMPRRLDLRQRTEVEDAALAALVVGPRSTTPRHAQASAAVL